MIIGNGNTEWSADKNNGAFERQTLKATMLLWRLNVSLFQTHFSYGHSYYLFPQADIQRDLYK